MQSWEQWIGAWVSARGAGNEEAARWLAHAPESWRPRAPPSDGARVLCAALARYRTQHAALSPATTYCPPAFEALHGAPRGNMCVACRDLKLGSEFPAGADACAECASDAVAWGTLPPDAERTRMLTKDQRRALRNADGQRRRAPPPLPPPVLPAQ